jgi:hypothetical protein
LFKVSLQGQYVNVNCFIITEDEIIQ